MRITSIKIKNFRGISFLQFFTGSINLIVGRNNTGKSSILEAIRLFFSLKMSKKRFFLGEYGYSKYILTLGSEKGYIEINNEKMEFFRNNNKLIKLLEKLRDTLIKISKKDKKLKYLSTISLERIGKVLKEEYVIFKFKNKMILVLEDYFSFLEKITRKSRLSLIEMEYLLENFFRKIEDLQELGEKISPLHSPKEIEVFFPDFEARKKEVVERLLRIEKIIKKYNILEGFERFQGKFIVLKNNKILPLHLFGDGFLQFLDILWKLEYAPAKFLLLDEPTAFMHPGYIKEFVKYLVSISKKKNVQIFIATHDIDLIETFLEYKENFLERELRILRLTKSDDTLLSKTLDFAEAQEEKDELYVDLRGI